jgi:hypothetical protein
MKELAIQYVPHSEMLGLSSEERIEKLLNIVMEDKIVLLEGQLKKTEEATLIAKTMESISSKFKGIELAVISPTETQQSFTDKVRSQLAKVLLGKQDGLTVVGPATVVRQIKQDPQKLQLFRINVG